MLKYTLIFLGCLLWTSFSLHAQKNRINFTSLSTKEGLLSNSVNAILKDRYGLMWFATDDGLNRFDGTNFTVYRYQRGVSTSLRANEVLALHEDQSGNLWIGTSGGGLSLYNRKKDAFINYPIQGNRSGLTRNDVIRSICSDYRGKIWIAEFNGLYMLDPATQSISKHILRDSTGQPVHTTLMCVFEDSKHRLWVGTDSGLFVYKSESNTFKRFVYNKSNTNSLFGNKVRAIAEDKWGNIWLGTVMGLCRLLPDESGFISYSQICNTEIYCVATDEAGSLWIGTGTGLTIYNTRTNACTVYTPEQGNIHSLTSKLIRCAYIDKQGIYWLGTYRGGINKYDKNINLFNLVLNSNIQKTNTGNVVIQTMEENGNGNVLMGSDGAGLFEFDPQKEQVRPFPIPLKGIADKNLSVLALHRTRANKLYIGTFAHGLIIMDQKTGKCTQLVQGQGKNGLTNSDIFCLQEDSKGNIWIGTNGGGINVVKNDQVIARFSPLPRGSGEALLPINGYIRAIEEDADGNIWIGSHGGGIAVYHPITGKWTIYNQENSQLPGNKIQCLHRDNKGNMWIGTFSGGLAMFDPQKQQITFYTEKDGLQNIMIYHIVEDAQGKLWLSTNTGISSFDPNTKKFRNFTSQNGLQNSNFVRGVGLRLKDGELYFGGLQGFNHFYPDRLTVNRNVPTVMLTDLRISNKSVMAGNDAPIKEPISIADEIRLEYKQNFSLGFVALNYTIPKQNHYAYKLDGFDKDWNYTGTINTASYTNLDPGEYIFRVKAGNNDGIWSSKDTTIKIYVKPPFWRTTYAYIFYVLGIAGLLLYSRYRGISRLRKKFALEQERQHNKRMQELDRLKLKFLTNLSHDFRTPISLIMGPVDQLIEAEGVPGKMDKLNMIRRNARRLLNLVNQLLDFRKMEEHELKLQLSKGEFISFIKEVIESFRDLSDRKHIHFTFTTGIDRLDAQFDHDKIERILFNLLSNAFKFTLEGGHINVELEYAQQPGDQEHTWISIKVIDSGIGISEDKKDMIFDRFFQNDVNPSVLNQGTGIGLSITKEFIKMHGGTIDVASEPGKGCTFTIQIPLKPAVVKQPVLQQEPVDQDNACPQSTVPRPRGIPLTNDANGLTEPLSVLLVEDNEDFRFYLKDNLRYYFKVIEAANGKEGWQKALSAHPQLIVSDISMPEMDGIALVNKLKSDKRTSHIPVILLTAMTGQEQQIKGLETGANDYITKPFNFEILNARIKNLLELNSTMKSTYSKQIKITAPEVTIKSSNEKLLQEIISYLEKNLTNSQLSVESLSKQLGMSRGTLYVKLLELTGQTPVEYIRSFRLNQAAALMEKSNMNITEIAYQVGFTTPNYFTKSFKSRFNMAPSEFIAKVRKANPNNNN